ERLYGPDLQVDHILPRSRSHDNSYDNKVLVYAKSNQNKGNNTPYEWLSSTDAEWTAYNTRIDGMHRLRKRKRMNLLNSSFAEEESCFADRNLNDTRYISKVITAYLDAIYTEAGHKTGQDKGGTRRVFARPGAMTSMVRKAWGLEEFKKDFNGQRIGDKHHAVDALVCACLAEGNAQWISRISNAYGSSEINRSGHIALRGLQPPWENFRSDVVTALSQITVSRRERCGAGGQLHLETVYRARKDEDGKKIALKRTSIVGKNSAGKAVASFTKIGDLDKIAGIHEERSRWLKDALQEWIKHGSPLEPELLPRDPQGCLIRKVYVQQKSMNLRKQPQGHVTSGTIVRCDVFSKVEKGKKVYHLVPVYNYQLIEKYPPMKAIMANKTEEVWTLLDQAYHFEFSLWKNSCIEIRFKDGVVNKGYYSGINRSNGRIAYKLPNDANAEKDETGEDLVFSTKSGVTSFHKITVDRLGRTFPVKSEKRTWRGAVCI
ncbi:MAG: type II CRISPR RNA-guided endonuclease Cas9, partial [Akkermansiaceae bacterium]